MKHLLLRKERGDSMEQDNLIRDGKAYIGIEFGSTRIKAVLIGPDHQSLACGLYDWQNQLENGVWTYAEDAIRNGLQACFADLMRITKSKFGIELTTAAGIGISAMMHGYLAMDASYKLLTPFRTWRNTMTTAAAAELTARFAFHIPQRWSIAHLYQAILNGEPHVGEIRHLTTLAGYVHRLLTGKNVLGIGDASGMFPINPETGTYDERMCREFAACTMNTAFQQDLKEILPEIIPVGECAGNLTAEGARLLDPTGTFRAGVPFCPPEGDAQTGMTATNSIMPRTGNVSAGTSVFSMVVLEQNLRAVHPEIDIVMTPEGHPTAMVHCNNCAADLDAWISVIGELLRAAGNDLSKDQLYQLVYDLAASGDPDCGGVVSCNYYSGEHITGLSSGIPLLMHSPDSAFTAANLLRNLVYASIATLKTGNDILTKEESVQIERICAHGGLFKNPLVTQPVLAAALQADVTVMPSAGEGGAWGIALLAAYMGRSDRTESLSDYLNQHVFQDMQGSTVSPQPKVCDGFRDYMESYNTALAAERAAVTQNRKGRSIS